jgi:hypothetical protein
MNLRNLQIGRSKWIQVRRESYDVAKRIVDFVADIKSTFRAIVAREIEEIDAQKNDRRALREENRALTIELIRLKQEATPVPDEYLTYSPGTVFNRRLSWDAKIFGNGGQPIKRHQ